MSEVINLILVGGIGFICAFWIMYSARMVAILVLLILHGQQGISRLEGVYTRRVGVSRRYYYTYQYTVNGNEYTNVDIITGAMGNRLLNKPSEKSILYVPTYPGLSGPYYARPFLAIMTFTFVAVGFFFTTIIGLSPLIDFAVSYVIWLLLVLSMMVFPSLAANKIIRRYFEANVPQNAVRQDMR